MPLYGEPVTYLIELIFNSSNEKHKPRHMDTENNTNIMIMAEIVERKYTRLIFTNETYLFYNLHKLVY